MDANKFKYELALSSLAATTAEMQEMYESLLSAEKSNFMKLSNYARLRKKLWI